ncbi:transposase [Moorena sp. SIO3I6]|uniref:transposase n=1 Tax=Moorena sp. SIO3I6 TaxID=2607831 RepID=UPI00344E0A76
MVNGILWILRTGAPWRDLPERYGKWQTVATGATRGEFNSPTESAPNGFIGGKKLGRASKLSENLQARADLDGKLNWQVHYVDGTVIRAHQHAAGGKKGVKKTNHGRRSRGGFSYLNTHTLVLVLGNP